MCVDFGKLPVAAAPAEERVHKRTFQDRRQRIGFDDGRIMHT